MESFIIYAFVGMLIGFLSGIFGIGGSIIGTPILKVFFNIPDLIALASPLPVTIPTAISGVYGHIRHGSVNKKIALAVIIGGLPATVIGAYSTRFISGTWLMILTGIFVVLTGVRLLKGKLKNKPLANLPVNILAGLIGVVTGFFSGLLAIGGGVILVPALILLLGLTIQEAAGISLLCVAFFAIPGTLVHWGLNHINWYLVLSLSVGVIPASYLGSRVCMSVKSHHLQKAFSVFLILFGIYFIFKQLDIFKFLNLK